MNKKLLEKYLKNDGIEFKRKIQNSSWISGGFFSKDIYVEPVYETKIARSIKEVLECANNGWVLTKDAGETALNIIFSTFQD